MSIATTGSVSARRRLFVMLVAVTAMIAAQLPLPTQPVDAQTVVDPTNTLRLDVISARNEGSIDAGDAVAEYEYLINIDNTGDPTQPRDEGCSPENPGYPDSCDWPSLRAVPGSSAIYTSGDQSDFPAGFDLPDGKYLVSVLADGYKVGGAHFTVPLPDTSPNVTVELHPNPLPAATMRIKVFEDISPVNGQFDAPAEQGLAGFTAVINDTAGELSADVFGNPFCTQYDAAGNPIALDDPANTNPNCMVSDADGDIVIPNLGPLRYDVIMVPPQGEGWIETTTLEGSPSWDTWLMEGGTGLDNEFVVAGEPFPWTVFGYVKPTDQLDGADTGGVSGTIVSASVYLPQTGGLPYYGDIWNGFNGSKLTGAIENAWVALSDLQNGDTAVYVGPANADGTYNIENVPDGDYLFTWFDENLSYILDWIQVTVADGEIYDMGTPFLTGWFTKWEGYVYNDLNQNGIRDPGEPGVPNYLVVIRDRDNSEIDRMSIAATTDPTGYYVLEKGYPMGWWMVLEAYNDRFYTTGVTYQVENQPEPTTILGAGVDVGILPMLGQTGRIDWGVHPYFTGEPEVPDHGGIAGSVFYDTTRNELDARYQAAEPWAPGIPELTVNLYGMVRCGTNAGVTCEPSGRYELAPDGSYAKGNLLNTTVTESWEQPVGCTARDVNGNILNYPDDQAVFQNPGPDGYRCLEGPVMGTQFQSDFATLPGNYGFGDIYLYDAETHELITDEADAPVLVPMPAGDYLVEVETPLDARERAMYQVVREEDINVFDGDQYVPAVPPPACAGALHTVDSSGNPNFVDAGGSPFEGMDMPLCDVKLVSVHAGKSIAPTFTFFTDVPIPGRWKGYIIDDLALSFNKADLFYGEKAGLPNSPIGIYDWSNKLVTTVQSDPNGTFEVLLPSTNTVNCPSPSGVCSAMYYILGNDPGQPGALNPGYNPQYRTIGATFEIYPGLIIPSDLAPTQIVVGALAGASQFGTPPQCSLDGDTPQLFAVSDPVYDSFTEVDGQITIDGEGFGAPGQVTLDGVALPAKLWTSRQIVATVPADTAFGPHQLEITNDAGMSTVNGLTFHVLGDDLFPNNIMLDDFTVPPNRSGNSLGSNWSGANSGNVSVDASADVALVTGGGGSRSWNPSSFGPNQEAYFTFAKVGSVGTDQGLLLKVTGPNNPNTNNAAWIQVAYDASAGSVTVKTKVPGTTAAEAVLQASAPATFNGNDVLGARAYGNGTVRVFKGDAVILTTNVTETATPWPADLAGGGGRIGVRFASSVSNFGNTNNSNNLLRTARFDDFGGGNFVAYLPNIYEVGSGLDYATIQSAVDAAAASAGDDLVVVHPDTPAQWNPTGTYYENVVVYAPVKIQGVGPGGLRADGSNVLGTVVDGRGVAGDTGYADDWRALVTSLDWDGNQAMYEGAVFYLLAEDGEFTAGFNASIDGMTIQGGDQQGFPNNLTPGDPTIKEFAAVQGGGIFANAYVRNLQITNNIMQSNGGAYGGAIRLGTPHLPGDLNDNQNDFALIADNRIIANGGTNLAGAIALFSGSESYEVARNDICGNFSAEYGGGISHYGLSETPEGTPPKPASIHDNRIFFNRSYDEGGGIMIAGELPADPATLSPGAGPVNVYANLIQNNLANDDGGGLRFLMAGDFPYNVFNNIIVNNVSTHEGGGVSLNDTPDVRFMNNTVMKNTTTATSVTSNGSEAPAGLSTSYNSNLLQATLPGGEADCGLDGNAPCFSDPLLFNNIFWDNRAGFYTGNTVGGIGLADDPFGINYWDLGVAGGTDLLSPTYSILQTDMGTVFDGSNVYGDAATYPTGVGDPANPLVVLEYDTGITVLPWRGNPRFVDVLMIVVDPAANVLGDYHLNVGSPAIGAAAQAKNGFLAPLKDYDGDDRGLPFDIGADEEVQ